MLIGGRLSTQWTAPFLRPLCAEWFRYLEANGYIHYDYGGNAGGTEVALMILDHYEYTQDLAALQRYWPIVNLTLVQWRRHQFGSLATLCLRQHRLFSVAGTTYT